MNRDEQSRRRPALRVYLLGVFTLTMLLGLPYVAQAQTQWTTNGNNINNTNTGNVGVGTAVPVGALEVAGTGYTQLYSSSYSNSSYPVLGMFRARGTITSPLAVQSGDVLGRLDFVGRTPSYLYGAKASIYGYAAENWTDSAAGAYLTFVTTPTGTINGLERMRIDPNGNVGIGTTTPSSTAKLDVNGNTNITGNITVTGNINAKYQDVAEWVPATHTLPAGTVVVLNPTKSNQVMASAQAYDTRVAGVVSERPGLALGEAGTDKVLVATTGRVKVKVDATRSPVHIGDLLVTSDQEGVAMKSIPLDLGGTPIHRPGTLIGKALEPLEKGTGEILVLLSLQ